MTARGAGDDGTIDDLPWASVFDPAANARALSAIQAEGFRAASRIVDRFVRSAAPDGNGHPTTPGPEANGHPAADTDPPGLAEFERFTRAWWSMAGQFLLRSMPGGARPDGDVLSLDVTNPDSRGALALQAVVGGSAGAEIWLHNRTPEDRADVRLRCSDLLSHEGHLIRADAVLLDSAVVPMPRRSSRGVAVSVTVSPHVRPGVYRGTLLGSGHPDLWLPVTLTVRLPQT